ncbi:hypothetical protein J6590_053744 [Homalodisca vitripennis]|nr:hypothetical protein J6590_053744 [Homalodisca vitripennis]
MIAKSFRLEYNCEGIGESRKDGAERGCKRYVSGRATMEEVEINGEDFFEDKERAWLVVQNRARYIEKFQSLVN